MENTIQIQHLQPIHLACRTDEINQKLQYVEVKNGIAACTDGTILVRYDLNLHNDELANFGDFYIHRKGWEALVKASKKYPIAILIVEEKDGVYFRIHDDYGIITQIGVYNEDDFIAKEGKFPDWRNIWTQAAEAVPAKEFHTIGINPQKTDQLRKAMGQPNSVTFHISDNTKAIKITIPENEYMAAILMPVLQQQVIDFPK